MNGPVVDLHAHLLPSVAWTIPVRDGVARITDRSGELHLDEFPIAVDGPSLADPHRLLADMDRCGIDVRVVSAPPYAFPLTATGPDAQAYCALVTDALIAACAVAPDRLVPVGLVPLQSAELAVAGLDRLVAAGVRAVAVPPILDGRPLGEGVGRVALEAAAARDVAVVVHPVQAARPELTDHYLRNLVGNPYETAVAVASCALGGVLDAEPALRILFVHGAGCAPVLVGRWDHGWAVRPDVGLSGGRPPSEVLRDRVFVDTLTHHPGAARLAADVFGTGALVLGSDYPFDMGDADPVASARRAGLEPAALSTAALRWLGRACPDRSDHAGAHAAPAAVHR